MRAIGYLRELSEPTLEAQQRAFLDHCARSGLEVGPTFTDTAAEPGSPEFRRMLRLLERERRSFTVVVAADLAVLGRQVREQARRYLQLAAAGLPLQLAGTGDVAVDIEEALLEAWAERGPGERRRERARQAMRTRALRSEVLGRPPYGYRISHRRLDVDPDEAVVVREMFRACLDDGEGVRRIARRLNDAAVLTRRGGPWSTGSVRDILRNPVYVGTYRRLGMVVPGAHEPIIEREQFDRAQRALAERRTSFGPQRRHAYLLAGLARCGHCGNRLIGARRPRRVVDASGEREYVYYQCESRTNQSRCGYHTRRAGELEAIVREQVANGPRARGDATPASVASSAASAAAPERERLEGRRRTLLRELDRMLERYAAGEWTAARLRAEAAPLVREDLAVEERVEALARREQEGRSEAASRAETDGPAILEAARTRLAEQWDVLPFEERRALLREVVAEVIATDDTVRVQFTRFVA